MAIDDADGGDSGPHDGGGSESEPVAVGAYTWTEYVAEYGADGDAEELYDGDGTGETPQWDDVDVDPETALGFAPDDTERHVGRAGAVAQELRDALVADATGEDPHRVVKGRYTWADFDRDVDGEVDRTTALGFDPASIDHAIARGRARAEELDAVIDARTLEVNDDLDEDAFFTTDEGETTIVNRYDLEKTVPVEKKGHFREVDRYWVNEPHAFVILFHSVKENETKYYVVEPYMNHIEEELVDFLAGKLRTAIKYSEKGIVGGTEAERRQVIQRQTLELLDRYDLYTPPQHGRIGTFAVTDDTSKTTADEADDGVVSSLAARLGLGGVFGGSDASGGGVDESETGDDTVPTETHAGFGSRLLGLFGRGGDDGDPAVEGLRVRPESAVIDDDPRSLNEYQVDKLLYYLTRDFIGYERIDGIKHDINVEDISCDGYNSPVFVYHTDHEQIISNVIHGEAELDDFVVKLAQRSGKGISKRRPQVDATLPDGSRAQLTLGREVSDHGTNYTIRQFKDVPFTPIDLINWNTFSLDEMAFLWLCIENHKSLLFAGGTASGKTTSLNAVSLFIPSNAKIVSIEDTREVELPQRNWIASVTRPSFSDDDKGDVDEFDLLEAALRQRPDYIVMGEIRGEEGRTLFQVMSTGHTTYTTFHADSVGEVLKRFTTDPINVSKTMFTALDLVSIQTSTRVQGRKVRRSKSLTEINHYDAENDEINVQDVYQWQAETDDFLKIGQSNTLEDIKFDRGWSHQDLQTELFKRRVVLAYLIKNRLNTYTQVAATLQAFINDPETILTLIANDQLERSLEDLRGMESVHIDIDPEKEEMVPRPTPDEDVEDLTESLLDEAEESLFDEYRGPTDESVASALRHLQSRDDITASPSADDADSDAPATEASTRASETDGSTESKTANGGETDASDESDTSDEPVPPADDDHGDGWSFGTHEGETEEE